MKMSDGNSISHSDFYEANLYRFQDGVLNTVKNLNTPLYLTGGTALSRGYYNHRYSDDLDFFVNQDEGFQKIVDAVLAALKAEGYEWSTEVGFVKTVDFCTVALQYRDYTCKLKVDFVNDVAAHFGEICKTPAYYRTDSIRNILSNKVSAIFRLSAKDIVDIYEICKHERFSWKEVYDEVREKELGVEPADVAGIFQTVPQAAFDSIKWIRRVEYATFLQDAEIIAKDMLNQQENSLCG